MGGSLPAHIRAPMQRPAPEGLQMTEWGETLLTLVLGGVIALGFQFLYAKLTAKGEKASKDYHTDLERVYQPIMKDLKPKLETAEYSLKEHRSPYSYPHGAIAALETDAIFMQPRHDPLRKLAGELKAASDRAQTEYSTLYKAREDAVWAAYGAVRYESPEGEGRTLSDLIQGKQGRVTNTEMFDALLTGDAAAWARGLMSAAGPYVDGRLDRRKDASGPITNGAAAFDAARRGVEPLIKSNDEAAAEVRDKMRALLDFVEPRVKGQKAPGPKGKR
jgi:hypothetical protein